MIKNIIDNALAKAAQTSNTHVFDHDLYNALYQETSKDDFPSPLRDKCPEASDTLSSASSFKLFFQI
jgi:hypothetical protein